MNNLMERVEQQDKSKLKTFSSSSLSLPLTRLPNTTGLRPVHPAWNGSPYIDNFHPSNYKSTPFLFYILQSFNFLVGLSKLENKINIRNYKLCKPLYSKHIFALLLVYCLVFVLLKGESNIRGEPGKSKTWPKIIVFLFMQHSSDVILKWETLTWAQT